MKTGMKDLIELATEIERRKAASRDFVANTKAITIDPTADGKTFDLKIDGIEGAFPVNGIAHEQIAEYAGIPKPYYDKMRREAPGLVKSNVEAWFAKFGEPRMVRTIFDGTRAFLSDKFERFDNHDFAEATLPILMEHGCVIESCEITERKLYIKAVDARLYTDVPVGYKRGDGSHVIYDTCAPVAILSNSEVGFGRLCLDTGVYTRACTNLAAWPDGGMKRTHVGARYKLGEHEIATELLANDTRKKMQEALWLQVRDTLKGAFNSDLFRKRCEKLTAASQNKIEGKVEKVLELAATKFSLNEDERGSILRHLIEGGSLTQYGLHSAITRASQDVADYDRATELEYLGGKVIELPRNEWQALAEAA